MAVPTRPAVSAASALTRLEERAASLLPLPPLDAASYARGHAAFEACSDQRQLLAGALTDRLVAGSPGSVLSVGCGDGALDEQVARRLWATGPLRYASDPLRYEGVDPNPQSAVRFLDRMREVPGVQASAAVERAEVLRRTQPVDAVLAIHCLYYVPDLALALHQLAALVRPGGRLLVALAPAGALNALALRLAPSTGGHRQWWAHDLAAALASTGRTAEQVTIDARLSLGGDPPRAVLDFVAQAGLPDALVPAVGDYLDAIGDDDDIAHPVELFTVSV